MMRTLGLLGGMSWESTAEYYRLINRGVAERLGGRHSARLLMHSIDVDDLAVLQRVGDWWAAGATLGDAARALERIGAEAIVLAANTMHEVATDIESAIDIPLIHIVDPTGEALARQGIRRAGSARDALHNGASLLAGANARALLDRDSGAWRGRSRGRASRHLQ